MAKHHNNVASNSRNALKFVRMYNVAATFTMGVNNPTPALSGNSTAIAP